VTQGYQTDRLYLTHVLECIANVESDVQGSRANLEQNRTVRDAVLRNLQVLAECTQRLSDQIKLTQPSIPWAQIQGFRHRLVHDYFRIDLDIVWRVVEQHLPELKLAVTSMLKTLDSP
jgi:uncharacterized protein with HEPN domain